MYRTAILTISSLVLALPASLSAQGVDYHKAQQAGKVWTDKANENNRKKARQRKPEAPVTNAEREAAKVRHREDYNRLVRSVGQKNADKWIDFQVLDDRRNRR